MPIHSTIQNARVAPAEVTTAAFGIDDETVSPTGANDTGASVEPAGAARTEPRARLPEAPLSVVLLRRARAVAHSSRTLITEYPWLSVGLALGTGMLLGRLAPNTVRKRVGLGLVTFVARHAARAVFKAIEDSTAAGA